ncbi:MAG: DNA glycosylase [Eubacteriales bacterium]|nr:DNA glycosylase [Eubacteriales bacterium]
MTEGIEMTEDNVRISGIHDFLPNDTFTCGQCFRWNKLPDASWEGIAKKRIIRLRFEEDRFGKNAAGDAAANPSEASPSGTLFLSPCTDKEFQDLWRPYLDLDRDYGKIKKALSQNDPVMKAAIQAGPGIRILHQELWETMLSFLISQNASIPRIRGCIERLSEKFGEPIGEDFSGKTRFSLPDPDTLAKLSPEELADVRLGYRAGYLIGTARYVLDHGMPETEEELMKCPGIGPKVASCIALFAIGKTDAFPIDVWVKRAMRTCYGIPEKDISGMRAFAQENFGEYGGFAQQYLFYYLRSKKDSEGKPPQC